MRLPAPVLDRLRTSDLDKLESESQGSFPLSELKDAARSGEASLDLEEWLVSHLHPERQAGELPDEVAPAENPDHPRQEGVPGIGERADEKNYEDGPAG